MEPIINLVVSYQLAIFSFRVAFEYFLNSYSKLPIEWTVLAQYEFFICYKCFPHNTIYLINDWFIFNHFVLILLSRYSANFLGQSNFRYLLCKMMGYCRDLPSNYTSYIISPFLMKELLIATNSWSENGKSLLSVI